MPDNDIRRELFTHEDKEVKALNKIEAKALLKQDENTIKELNKRLRATQKNLKTMLKATQERCKTIKNKEEKTRCREESQAEVETEINATVALIKTELDKLKASQAENKGLKEADKERIKNIKERLETLRKELLQEVMMVERCKNIRLV